VQDRRSQTRHVRSHLHARRIQDREARGYHHRRDIHRADQRRTAGRPGRGNADGHRLVSRGRRHQQPDDIRRQSRGTRRDTTARALLIPGTTVTPFVLGQYNLTVHGSSTSDFTMAIDGLRVNNLCGSGQYSGFYMNDAAVQELTYTTGSQSAEIQSSGIRVNTVPKDGGNRFSGTFFAYGQGSSLQSDNRTDAMKVVQANGQPVVAIAGTAYDWQINPSFGGPLAKDKLWFYFTY